MSAPLLWILTCLILAIMAWSLAQRDRMIQYPFLAASVFLGWVLPQLAGLTHHHFLPQAALEKTILMAILCLAAAWAGYAMNRKPAKLFWWRFDRQRLLLASMVLSVLGAFFFYRVGALAADVSLEHGGQWTGVITIYVFFSRLLTVGMVIALVLHLNRPSLPTALILLFALSFYAERILIRGRRAAMVELGLMLMMALWFHRRWLPPRWLMLSLVIAGALVVNSIGDYRSTMLQTDRTTWTGAGIGDLLEIDYVGNLLRLARGEGRSRELTNAVMNIEAADRSLDFDLGLSHWNAFVDRYVPGQWFGQGFKDTLTFDFPNLAYAEFRYIPGVGSTHTGLSDAFRSFWYFGFIKFYLIGLIMSRWYRAAVQGNVVAQMISMLLVAGSLQAITHSTHAFFNLFVQLAAFLLPALIVSRIGAARGAVLRSTPTGRLRLGYGR